MKATILRIQRTLSLVVCLLITTHVHALEAIIDGLVYNLSGVSASVLHVASGNTSKKIVVPATVVYDGLTYTVNAIGAKAFSNFYNSYYYWDRSQFSFSHTTNINTTYANAIYNSYVREIELPNTIHTIEKGAFANNLLTQVIMKDGITSIGDYAFAYTTFSDISLPPTVESIGAYAFDHTRFTSITIPASVKAFGTSVFADCDLLRTIIYCGATPPTNWVATSQTYYPNGNFSRTYSSPKYSMNNAQMLPMFNWGNYFFVYTGKTPEVECSSNIEGYAVTLDLSNLNKCVSSSSEQSDNISVTLTSDKEAFTAYCNYTYVISRAPLTVKICDESRTYGEGNPTFTCTYTGFVNNEDASVLTTAPTISTTATAKSNVGTYAIQATGAVAQNYSFTYEDGTLTVMPANLAVTVNDATREYGDENPAFSLTYSGLKNEETEPAWTTAPIFTTEATAKSDVGTYAVDVTAEPKNYTIMSKQTGTLTITQAPLTLKADDATRPYYADDPEFTFTCEGFKNDDDASVLTVQPTFTPDAIKRSYVGTYDLNVEGADAKNYNISYVPATLTITPRPLYVKVNNANRVYGDQNPSFELTYEGFVNNETEQVLTQIPTITTAATVNSDAGTYDLYVGDGKATNYELSYQQGQLTVTQRPLTVSVGDYERDYGEENPAFELIYDNFGSSDDETSLVSKPVARTTATRTSDVGTYAINVTGGASPNYTFTYVPGSLTVNRAEQIFTWEQDLSELRVGDQVELKAIASSGLPVTFTFADNDIVDVYQAGRKTYMECLNPGTVVIKAQQEGNKNYYPTQRITKTIVVNVATSVDAAEESTLRVHPTSFGIRILNASNETANIYTADGVLVKSVKVAGEQTDIELPANRVYLVKIGDKTVKVMR